MNRVWKPVEGVDPDNDGSLGVVTLEFIIGEDGTYVCEDMAAGLALCELVEIELPLPVLWPDERILSAIVSTGLPYTVAVQIREDMQAQIDTLSAKIAQLEGATDGE